MYSITLTSNTNSTCLEKVKRISIVTFQEDSPYKWAAVSDKMFGNEVQAKYFERAVYSRRASRYVGTTHDRTSEI